MTEAEAITKGNRALSELGEIEWAFDQVRAIAIAKWSSTGIDAVATREKYFSVVQTIDMVRKALGEVIANGQVAAHSQDMAALLAPDPRDRR